jgi:chromosome segregation protein
MKIKRLEISGFKSFADRVVLDFQQGVTGVVGPNGCGKSNIVDAIRWCMGEQSAKHLRGKSMEDVIFAGSEIRRPLGMAEVSLTFSTEDGRAPAKYLDYAEIQLTRRLYRDGESDYLINKTACRLLDITELFMDTGVGTRAYSIIEQGKIGQILHSRPEERRFLIEEAAGVTKFKSRKLLALKKIESTRQNLARLADVLGEIRRQLSSLQRQARKAEKFREVRDELREIELLFTAREYHQAQLQRAEAERGLAGLNDRFQEVCTASALAETRMEQTRLELAETERTLTVSQEDIYRVKSEFGTAESALEFQRKELGGLEGRLGRLESEAGELEKRLKECAELRQLLELRRDTSSSESASMVEQLQQAEVELAGQGQNEEDLNRVLEARRKELFTALAESAQFKSRHESAQKRLSGLTERLERHRREVLQLGEGLVAARVRASTLQSGMTVTRQEQELLQAEATRLRAREEDLAGCLPDAEKKWQAGRDELSRSASRLHSLRELEAQFAGYGQGVINLMKSEELRPGFSGVLADAIETAPELEAAVEAVLAEWLQCIVCPNDADALQSLEFLRNSNGGRVGLALPLKCEPPGVITIANATQLVRQVQLSGPCAALIGNILADVMLVDELKQAIELARLHPRLSFVTRSGDMVTRGGVVSGGSTEQLQKGIIHKKREIKELESLVAVLERDLTELGKQRDELKRQSLEVAERLKSNGTLLHQSELKLAGLQKDHQQALDEAVRIEERQTVLALEAAQLDEEHGALVAELKLAAERLSETGSSSQLLEQEVVRLKAELEAVRGVLSASRERVITIRVQEATLREQHEAHLRGISDLDRQTEELRQRIASGHHDTEKGVTERVELQSALAAGTGRLEDLVRQQVAAEARLADVRAVYEVAVSNLAAAEALDKNCRDEHEAVRQSQSELTLRFSTLNMQAEHLERGLQEKSRITMAEALARLEQVEFDEAASRVRQVDLQRMLDDMGEVNLMAIDECAGMEERFTFLTSQKDDLEESLRSLQQAIQRINRTTRQRFQETYDLINAKFQEVFPRLFCGGRAELRLTNEDDLLETGIDIIVQPPGKKLQNVTLLSGGEKALTAVALIFSIFLIKPTPFCLLDEVDAPLDDANIGRFNEMVREMSAVSQFIIITHNKATMQVADTLYGITMEEPGASKVVSVRLH